MLKNPEDRRARRTRRLLKESLLELMEQKHFSEISVRDVTDNADMNRTTFYLHYTDTTQLLQSMEEDLLAEAQVLVDAHIQETVADGTLRPCSSQSWTLWWSIGRSAPSCLKTTRSASLPSICSS